MCKKKKKSLSCKSKPSQMNNSELHIKKTQIIFLNDVKLHYYFILKTLMSLLQLPHVLYMIGKNTKIKANT